MATTITANGINFPDGSASAPSIGGTDTNTGLFTGSDIVGFATGGLERIRIDSSGRLLLGTTTEGHAAGDNLTVADAGNSGITIRSGTSNNGVLYFSDGTSGSAEYKGAVQYNHTDNYLRFYTNGDEKLRIDSNGLVSIGSSSSVAPLYVLSASNNTIARFESGDATCRLALEDSAGEVYVIASGNDLVLANTSSITERLRITSDGQVQIGGDSSVTGSWSQTHWNLEVHDSAGDAYALLAGASGAALELRDTVTNEAFVIAANGNCNLYSYKAGDDMGFHTKTSGGSISERLRITSGGSVNIGGDYTQSTYKAQITGDLLIQKAVAAYDHPQLELYATNNTAHGGAIKFSAMYNTKYQLAKIRATGGSGSPNSSGGGLHFFTGDGSRKVEFQPDGDVAIVDGNLVVASGHGIDFSATANSSGTITAELLDDYEYGSFTPFIEGSTTSGSVSYSARNGFYIKIGRLVQVYVDFTVSSWSGAAGNQRIGGFPFTKNELSGQAYYYEGVAPWYVMNNLTNSKSNYQGYIGDNNTLMNIYVGNTCQTDTTGPVNVTGRASFSFTYTTSS